MVVQYKDHISFKESVDLTIHKYLCVVIQTKPLELNASILWTLNLSRESN